MIKRETTKEEYDDMAELQPEVSIIDGVMPAKEVIEKVVDELANILKAIHELLYLYEQNNWLRDGIDISGIVPMSIDEWCCELSAKIDGLRYHEDMVELQKDYEERRLGREQKDYEEMERYFAITLEDSPVTRYGGQG